MEATESNYNAMYFVNWSDISIVNSEGVREAYAHVCHLVIKE